MIPLAVAEIGPGREGMDVDETAAPLRGHLADEIHESLSAVVGDAPNGCRLAFVLHPGASHAAAGFHESDGYIVATWPLEVIHERWCALPDGQRPLHPLGPLVRNWQGRPRHVGYCKGDERGRILPTGLAMTAANGTFRRTARLFLPAAHVVGAPNTNGRRLIAPGFERSRNLPALPVGLVSPGHR